LKNTAILILFFLLNGCAVVKPWERAYFADPIMIDEDVVEMNAFDMHMHRALSQGLIGSSVKAGGCGCEQ